MNKLVFIIGGAVTSLGFAPYNLWIAPFIGLGIWYSCLTKFSLSTNLLGSYFFGLALLLPTQNWTGVYVGNIPWLILCSTQALLFLVPPILVSKKEKFRGVAFASSFAVVELLLRTIPFTGFGWSRIGFTQYSGPLNMLYPLGGVALVSFTIAYLITIRKISALLSTALIFTLVALFPIQLDHKSNLNVALIQGGVKELGLGFNSTPKEVFQRHLDLTKTLNSKFDLVIWPENSVDIDINMHKDVREQIISESKRLSAPILVGGVTNSTLGLQNQSMLFNPRLTQIYTKRYLTPFGEYIPARSIAEAVSPYAKEVRDFKGGTKEVIFGIKNATFNTLICYEILDDRLISEISSNFVVVQTNNATFGDTQQLEQQLNIARVRSLELSRPIAYVSTTGITSFIDSQGRIDKAVDKFDTHALTGSIQLVEGQTLAQRFSKYIEPFSLFLLFLIVVKRVRKS